MSGATTPGLVKILNNWENFCDYLLEIFVQLLVHKLSNIKQTIYVQLKFSSIFLKLGHTIALKYTCSLYMLYINVISETVGTITSLAT